MVRTTDLEKYLVEPIPLLEKVDKALEKIKEYNEILTKISEMEQSTINLFKATKDPKTHTAEGVISLYSNHEGLTKAIEETLPSLKNRYKITVDGIDLNIRKNSLKTLWDYRLNRTEQNIGHLYFIYKDDIAKYINEQKDVFERMQTRYK